MNTDIYISKFHEEAFSGILSHLKNVDPLQIGENHIVIVPDRYTLSIEKLIFGSIKSKGSFNISVLTLKRLARLVAPNVKYISANGAVMMIRKTVKELSSQLKCYNKSSTFPSFSKSVYKEICRLKSIMVTPEELKNIAEKEKGETAIRLFDIALIYSHYEELIKDTYADTEGYLNLIADNCKNSKFVNNSHFYIAGFDYFTKAEQYCLKNLSKSCKQIAFALTNQETYLQVKNNVLSPDFDIKLYNIADSRDKITSYIFNNAENFSPKPYAKDCDRIKLYAFNSITEETENTAQQILKDIKQDNLRFKDICVVLSGISSYLYSLDKVFKRYNIPYYISESSDLSCEPLFKALYNLLSATIDNCSLINVLAFVKSCYFGANKTETDIFENYCYKFGIDRSRFTQPFTLSDDDNETQTAEKVRNKFYSYYKLLKDKNSLVSLTDCVRNILDMFLSNTKKDIQNILTDSGYPDEAAYRGQAYEKINRLLNEIDEINPNSNITLKEFTELLFAGASSVKLSIIPVSGDCVNCGGFDLPRYLNAKSIYIMGAVEGKFPDYNFANSILNYNDIKSFSQKDFTDNKTQLMRERERIKLLLCNQNNLSISCYLTGEDGKECKPSEYFSKLKTMFALNVDNRIKYRFKMESITANNYSDTLSCGTDLFFNGGTASVSAIETYFSCPRKFLYRYGFFAMPRKEIRLKSLDKGIFLHAVIELFVKDYKKDTDVTSLAEKCYESVLSRKEYRRYSGDALKEAAFVKLKEEILRTCKAVADGIDNSDFKPEYIEAEFDRKGAFPLITLLSKNSPLCLRGKIDRADVYTSGNNKYIRVIDYKSGNIKYEDKNLYFGNKVQLFMYMFALQQCGFNPAGVYYFPVNDKFGDEDSYNYRLKGVTVNEEGILNASDYNIKEKGESQFIDIKLKQNSEGYTDNINLINKADFDSYLSYAINICQNAAEEIAGGNTALSPVEKACDYCDYASVCALNKDKAVTRKQLLKKAREVISEAANG